MIELYHHAASEELEHLEQTLAIIEEETERLAEEVEAQSKEVVIERLSAGGLYSSDLIVAETLFSFKQQSLHHLRLAADRTYFTRVDFTPDEDHILHTYYIGKWGISQGLRPIVIDWRAPIANLYYAGQLGPVTYEAPDGKITGALSLKRQLGVKNGQLETIFDTDVAARDAYLMGVLGEARGERLRDVVSTIQAEQNIVIRHLPQSALIVQGVAGSGKTTIALHRIAYLLYAYRESIAPKHMMILAPNPLFLDYISAVLPDLGVDQVVQTTFPAHIASLLGKHIPKIVRGDSLDAMIEKSEADRQLAVRRARFAGSLRFRSLLLAYIDQLEQNIVPSGNIVFGPVTLYTNEQIRHIFLTELAPFPFERRIAEIPKYLAKKRKSAQEQARTWYETECNKRAEQIFAAMPDTPERRERMIRLYNSRDERLEEIKARGKSFEKDQIKRWLKLDLLEQYHIFLSNGWKPPIEADEQILWDDFCAQKLAMLAQKQIELNDLAPLATLALRLFEFKKSGIRHTVIDEAQDFSPFQFMLLRELSGNDSFTIVGDLMQGVRAFEGLQSWEEIIDPVFAKRAALHPLQTSYRSTVEIMLFASKVAMRNPVPGQLPPKPVLRHGMEPSLHGFQNNKQRNQFIVDTVYAMRAEGYQTIAIIDKSAANCAKLSKALPAALQARLVRVGDTDYAGGVQILPATLTKGLEFDCVILADVGDSVFTDTQLDARLLYVCLTRPLHRLFCCYTGRLTALLDSYDSEFANSES